MNFQQISVLNINAAGCPHRRGQTMQLVVCDQNFIEQQVLEPMIVKLFTGWVQHRHAGVQNNIGKNRLQVLFNALLTGLGRTKRQ